MVERLTNGTIQAAILVGASQIDFVRWARLSRSASMFARATTQNVLDASAIDLLRVRH